MAAWLLRHAGPLQRDDILPVCGGGLLLLDVPFDANGFLIQGLQVSH